MNKDEILGSGQQKLMDIDLMVRNWSLTFQYFKYFTQLRYTADMITGQHAELRNESGLQNILVKVWPFPTSATLKGIRTSQNIPLSHVTDFYLLFPKDARATTCFENRCYQNMQLTTCGRNFKNMPMNILDQQFFYLQLNASNLDLFFEATDENSNGALTFDGLDTQNQNTSVELREAPIYQGATDLYYNIDTNGKRPQPPILCTIHDIF
ncbi:MAG: hypothetical protein EZS28_004088 [Streblomastix strix]|uniref:Uncharacterized protein n=1 Tax=Streblomastix strix TaxID=222440 RepID=A0A5J4X195_9EUKA|nr:MAG: hypothetical protein EZS28_004088 [Streblomastix strix]